MRKLSENLVRVRDNVVIVYETERHPYGIEPSVFYDLTPDDFEWLENMGDRFGYARLDNPANIVSIHITDSGYELKSVADTKERMVSDTFREISDHIKGHKAGDAIGDLYPEIGGKYGFKDGIYNGETPDKIYSGILDSISDTGTDDGDGAWAVLNLAKGMLTCGDFDIDLCGGNFGMFRKAIDDERGYDDGW